MDLNAKISRLNVVIKKNYDDLANVSLRTKFMTSHISILGIDKFLNQYYVLF